MMVNMAGSITSGIIEPDNEVMSSCGQKDYTERLAEYANEKGISIEVAEDGVGQMVIDQTAAGKSNKINVITIWHLQIRPFRLK